MGTKRMLIATVLLVISVLSAVPCSAASPLELLVGPVAPIGSTAYDKLALTQGAIYRDSWPQIAGDVVGSNYYDLALALYLLYYRTGDTSFRDKARTIAEANRDVVSNQDIYRYLAADYTVQINPPRAFSTLGMAVYVLEHGDSVNPGQRLTNLGTYVPYRSMSQIVGDQAGLGARNFSPFDGNNAGMRESAYAMIAMIAATVIGAGDFHAQALAGLNSYLASQGLDRTPDHSQPNGCWQDSDQYGTQVPAIYFIQNFMVGLVLESLTFYDRAFGDPRIVPAMQNCVGWMWSTQWVPTVPTSSPAFGAFKYANINSGTVNTNPYANLSGVIYPAWGYLYLKTGNATYKTQGDTIMAGMVAGAVQAAIPGSGIYDVKQFGQEFRSSPRYLGFTASSLSAPTGLVVH